MNDQPNYELIELAVKRIYQRILEEQSTKNK